ncbi:hypothetical protein V5R04_15460 [Jonesiaceae bacterium BS-20]|uniref:HIRAN domain-containing protein n=1 Tax=Jonesiaceae bacterium BS-20 TaxID=3120821 RepID=A0AAU7DWC3_9MICO
MMALFGWLSRFFAGAADKQTKSSKKSWVAPAPHLPGLEPFLQAPKSKGEKLTGTWHYREASRKFLRFHYGSDGYHRASFPALLVRDPMNPHDANAVAVAIEGQTVGYLSAERAAEWAGKLDEIAGMGYHLQVVGTLDWSGHENGSVNGFVRLPDPALILPVNLYPGGDTVLLQDDRNIQVTKENEHMDVLGPYVQGPSTALIFTAHAIKEVRARSAINAVEIRLDRQRIGVFTPTRTEEFWNLVTFLEERGITPAVRGELTGNSVTAEVVLRMPRVEQIPQEWFDQFRERPVSPLFFESGKGSEQREDREFMWDDDDLRSPDAVER